MAKTAEMGWPLTAACAAFLANSSFSSGLEGGVMPRLVGWTSVIIELSETATPCNMTVGVFWAVLGRICRDFFTMGGSAELLFLVFSAEGGSEVVLLGFLALLEIRNKY